MVENDDWDNMFENVVAGFLPESIYDHCPCVIRLENQIDKKSKAFRFYNMWT